MTSRYADQRLAALWDRVASLESTVERAGAILESGQAPESALDVLRAGIMEDFKRALLCTRETTDEQLDTWLVAVEDVHA